MRYPSAEAFIEDSAAQYAELADTLWDFAEGGFEEKRSAEAHALLLEAAGFRVTREAGGIPTALVAEAGNSGPVVALLGEYDALPGMSQESHALECRARAAGENRNSNGHGCGHHLLGAGAHLAAVAVKRYLESAGIAATVRFYGCPAEETGYGKTHMVRAGLFRDVDAALTWHPGVSNGVLNIRALAVRQAYFRFRGIAAHAGAAPHLGRSALDALELMNIGVNFLREHMIPDARIHYAITNAGGSAPNVVQATAEVLYLIRAPHMEDVDALYERVVGNAKGAAMMTGCEVEAVFHSSCPSLLQNTPLNAAIHRNMTALGAPSYRNDEWTFAGEMQSTARAEEIALAGRLLTAAWRDPRPLYDTIDDYNPHAMLETHASTDVGDVSWVVPTAQCVTACYAFGTSPHSWQWVSQGKHAIAHKGMVLAAKTMASTALDVLTMPELRDAAKSDFEARRLGRVYRNPIPQDSISPWRRTG